MMMKDMIVVGELGIKTQGQIVGCDGRELCWPNMHQRGRGCSVDSIK